MADYTYKLENNEYVFYEDGEVLTTPNGAVIKTGNEELARHLEGFLKRGFGYSSPTSLLTYHYTFCNLNKDYTQEFVANDFSNCVGYESLMNDDYLMFRQSSPVRQAIAVFFEKELPECFHKYTLNQLAAVLVINTAYHSWMLSHYIIADIIEPLYNDDNAKVMDLKQEFLDDLEEFECEEFGYDPDDDAYIRHLDEISHTIDAFVYYFIS